MKVIFDRDVLIAALIPASAIAPTRNTVVAVEGLLFECPGEIPGTCRLSAYDLEKGMRTSLPARIMEEGKFVLNAQNTLQIVRSMPQGEVTITVGEKNRATISGGNSSFEIMAAPGDDFPMLPLLRGERYYIMPQYRLKNLVSGVHFAVAQNDQRVAFNGALLLCEDGVLSFIGCDSNRLAVGSMPAPAGKASPACRMIVPGRLLGEVMKLIRDTEEDVTVMLSNKNVMFHVGNVTFFTRIIDVDYIDYKRILPKESAVHCFLSTDAMRGAIERASLITEDKMGGNSRTFVKLEFSEEKQELEISAVTAAGGVKEVIPASITGGSLVIGFNCKYLLDILRACPDEVETLHLALNNPLMGMTVENGTSPKEDAPPSEEPAFTYFVMPVRMNGR